MQHDYAAPADRIGVVNVDFYLYIHVMIDSEFDAALVASAFSIGAERGWRHVSAAAAAREGGLDLARARQRFVGPGAILRRFGQLADEHALKGALTEGAVRDRLFDVLLRRVDFLQLHRSGVLALLRMLPLDAPLAAWLAQENRRSMGWMLEAAGISALGIQGELRKTGLMAVWGWGIRAWVRDESEDLSATMAAFDVALNRAEQIASRFAPDGTADGFTPEVAIEAELTQEDEAAPAFEPEPDASFGEAPDIST